MKHQNTNCTRAKIDLKQGRVQKLLDNKWLIILKEEEVLSSKCETKSEYKRISGIHIASITSDCQMQVLNQTLTTNINTVAVDEIIPLPSKAVITEENIQFNLQLEDTSLDSIHELIERADNLQEPTIDWQTMMATPSWTTLGLYLILMTILLWKLWQWK